MFKRKNNRLSDYDYGQAGAYFITVCTKDRQSILSEIIGTEAQTKVNLSAVGSVAEEALLNLPRYYPEVSLEGYVIMPNHIHMILFVNQHTGNRQFISKIINQWKGIVVKRIGFSIWQKSFHDHVVRDFFDYDRLQEYMMNNPAQWHLDSLHPDNKG